MVMLSTRGKDKKTISDAILQGLALDGGLFVPEKLELNNFDDINIQSKNAFVDVSYRALSPFFKNDSLESELLSIIKNAFNFDIPLTFMKNDNGTYLNLYSGPSGAFKDFGARFLAFSLEAILKKKGEKLTILVATSGDTGTAVASAFYKRENIKVKILFPKNGVSPTQKKLLTIWGNNIQSYEVSGTFDDCQKMVKEAFNNREYKQKYNLTSANSINIGRLLPQMCYYVYSSLLYKKQTGVSPMLIVPSGNVGNVTAAFYAKTIGAPINNIAIAQNANRPVVDYLEKGIYEPRKSVKTYANAMDVGSPSNIERLFSLFNTYEKFKSNVTAFSVSDNEILTTIKDTYEKERVILCPHTATAKKVHNDYYKNKNAIVVCTAHPGKFESVIKKAIGVDVSLPQNLIALLSKKSIYKNINANFKELFYD